LNSTLWIQNNGTDPTLDGELDFKFTKIIKKDIKNLVLRSRSRKETLQFGSAVAERRRIILVEQGPKRDAAPAPTLMFNIDRLLKTVA
jgi:hypothetical protein